MRTPLGEMKTAQPEHRSLCSLNCVSAAVREGVPDVLF